MTSKELIRKYRNILTILLSLIGIGFMAYYDYCDTECSYLKGDIWDIDLKWIGIVYMSAIIAFAVFKQTSFVRTFLATGLGVEVHLYAFQIQNDVYCPFCLAFSVTLILSFIINYEIPSVWRENRRRMWLYFLGEVDFSMFKIYKLPLLLFSLAGYLFVLFTLSGSVTPSYGQETVNTVPSLGKGNYEILMFTSYFCSPCKRVDDKSEPLLKELLATNQVKITFIDVPGNRDSIVYAKYYLYAANANSEENNIFRIRKILYEAAQVKFIEKEDALITYLKEKEISWEKMNEKSIFPILDANIKQNNIKYTPTCVIKYSGMYSKKFVGDKDIWNGLTELKARISAGK
ncbi:MAG: thioredoxin domain-containing protein [Syntrophaceae bacterium]|nr:thioredoxin domain-containing protein [Syntrophaceae bacterium]